MTYSGPLLQTGNLSDYTALGEVGHPVYAAAPQIRTAIARQIGQDVADFLAVPKHHVEGKSIDWYAPVSGDIVPWSAASPEERAKLTGEIERFRLRIAAHAEKILASGAEGDQRVFGLLLQQATRIPDDNHLFLVGSRPVITFWGFLRVGDDRQRDVLGQLRGATLERGAPVGAALETARPVGWGASRWMLAGLLPLLLLLLFAWWALQFWNPFGFEIPEFPIALGPKQHQEENQLQDPTEFDGTVVHGGTTLDGTMINGTGSVTGTAEGQTAGQELGTEADQNAQNSSNLEQPDQGGNEKTPPTSDNQDQPNQGPNTSPAPDPNQQVDQQPVSPQPPIAPIDIPDNANDPSFLAGDLRSETGLRDLQGRAASVSYKFDNKGQGTTTVRLGDGSVCQGSSTASVNDGRVTIQDNGSLDCGKGRTFRPSTTVCEKSQSDGKTRCKGSYEGGGNFNVVLGR